MICKDQNLSGSEFGRIRVTNDRDSGGSRPVVFVEALDESYRRRCYISRASASREDCQALDESLKVHWHKRCGSTRFRMDYVIN